MQAIFSVAEPHGDIYLVVRIEKVLQGSVSSALEQYTRTDVKSGSKLHKTMVPYCQRLGTYHMPFAVGARYKSPRYTVIIFVHFSRMPVFF